ncbi:Alcohol acetyltransferase/N-acetyltransferase [Trinorchestia longiramus]|nr:Alcohol acetyltransferase/N-acetyltransferase [Trinorchestia longiramus]
MSSSSDFKDRVLRKLTPLEKFFQFSHDYKFNLSVYCLTVATKSPLLQSTVHSALQHLYRKLPNFRVCFQEDEESEWWMCRMKEEKISLQWRSSPEEFETVYIEETRKLYDVKNGPLWRVTVMPAVESSVSDPDDTFSHAYRIMFGLHHSITDGHSSMRMCGYFLGLLDSVIEGITIDDNEQFASHVGPEHHDKLIQEVQTILNSKPDVDRKMRDDYNAMLDAGSLLTKTYPPPTDSEKDPQILTLFTELNKATTSGLLKKMKSEKVSVHCGFFSIIHSAFTEMFQEAGLKQETYDIVSYHDVNERRYWSCEGEKSFGPHIGMMRILFPVEKDIQSKLWDSARRFYKVFHEYVDEKNMFFMDILDAEKFPPVTKSADIYKNKVPCLTVYNTSNMGNVTSLFLRPDGSEYSHVKALQIRRSTSVHSYMTNNVFCLQTFRGKLVFSFDYNTRYISTDLAKKIVNKVLIHLRANAE